jgi:hypothetical protein
MGLHKDLNRLLVSKLGRISPHDYLMMPDPFVIASLIVSFVTIPAARLHRHESVLELQHVTLAVWEELVTRKLAFEIIRIADKERKIENYGGQDSNDPPPNNTLYGHLHFFVKR